MDAFTIKDLESLSGIKAHTLRIWEQRYNFLKPRRTTTNIRYYSNDELKTVLNIALLNKYGFKVSHIDRMQPNEIQEKILALEDGKAVQERLINLLVKEMIDLDMEKFETILSGHIAEKGLELTILQVVFPFLEKTGMLWQTGHINPAQEHLVVNIIRQKLIVAIETCCQPTTLQQTVVLFLPEGERHELGLLFVYYLLKNRGAKTIYLGADVPVKDIEYIIQLKKPDLAFVHLTSNSFGLEKFLRAAHLRFSGISTIISGQGAEEYRKKPPPSIQLKKSLPEVMEFIAALT